ncbi:glycoside hydrolase family 1 protein, partial [Candidatus Azambacteria bacterium]|nr:glycoside hydrolase family 1 protein [Candidatus Azambacteria bacterium]
MNKLIFPKNFYWGAATSSHQVEGDNHNDWSEWETKDLRFKIDDVRFKNWSDDILKKYPNPLAQENYISSQACDHYHRFEQDFDLAQSLNHNAHRFSIEWSRIEPQEGQFDENEIRHYQKVISALKARNLEPFITLWHWTNPTWFAEKKGFLKKENIKYFVRFVSYCANHFKNAKFFIILNEPNIYTLNSYLRGLWPPQKTSFVESIEVYLNLIQAHQESYDAIKRINNQALVGIAKNNSYFEIAKPSLINKTFKKMADYFWNHYFLEKISDELDFIGLNYYFHTKINISLLHSPQKWFSQNKNGVVSDLGWEIYPKGIYEVLKDLKKYGKLIYITENGLA